MRGRPGVPAPIKKAKRTYRPHRDDGDAQYADADLSPPPDLSAEALPAWQELAPMLHAAGVLKTADRAALIRACECLAEIKACDKAIAEHGIIYETTGDGGGYYIKTNPAVHIRAQANRLLLQYLTHFGMTPATRSKVKTEPVREIDPADAYFN